MEQNLIVSEDKREHLLGFIDVEVPYVRKDLRLTLMRQLWLVLQKDTKTLPCSSTDPLEDAYFVTNLNHIFR